jgi:type VI protein secretion system component VasK
MRSSRSSHAHRRTLRAQADVPHTFGTLLIPLAVLLAGGGGYQLERTVTHPLESDAATILFGSVTLACGLLLGLYLLRAVRVSTPPTERADASETRIAHAPRTLAKSFAKESPPPRPFHRYYVDGARISR